MNNNLEQMVGQSVEQKIAQNLDEMEQKNPDLAKRVSALFAKRKVVESNKEKEVVPHITNVDAKAHDLKMRSQLGEDF